jgi:hypothetical protein
MADAPKSRGINYEATVASLMALLALTVSAYTAWIQRQQVRAQVMPLLEYGTSNQPALNLTVANKGVGPARIEHVVFTFDGKPLASWVDLHRQLFRADEAVNFSTSLLGRHIVSPGEELQVYALTDKSGQPMGVGDKSSPGFHFNAERLRVGIELCYCSTLDECWILTVQRQQLPETTAVRRCPDSNARTFHE